MIIIGSYLTGKGAELTENSEIVGVVLTPIGLFMLCFSFITANTLVNGEFPSESPYAEFLFFFCMIVIGIHLTGKGAELAADYGDITGVVFISIGVLMLLFSFIRANEFVSGEFVLSETFLARIIFFGCMLVIGGYLTMKGASELMGEYEAE